MTAINTNTEIRRSGNRAGTCAFDVIFPGITSDNSPNYALASHPVLECWDDSNLNTVNLRSGDTKLFWTGGAYEIGDTNFLGSVLRAIPTSAAPAGANWALNGNQTGGTAYPSAGKGRCLKGNIDSLPLFPNTDNFLGDGNAMINRASFNLAAAIHDQTSRTPGDLSSVLAIRYTFLDLDPECSVRGNTNSTGDEPTATGITSLNHEHMRSIFGDDPDLSSGNRPLWYGEEASSNAKPFMNRPTSAGFAYSHKVVAGTP